MESEGTEQEKENTLQECTNTQTWRPPRPSALLHCYSLQDVLGSALLARPDANHRISDISLRPPPTATPTTSAPPQLQSLWECFVQTQLCRARTVVRYIKSGEHGYEDHWPPSALKGLISTDRPALCPPRREGGACCSSPVLSTLMDGGAFRSAFQLSL